MYKPIGDYGVIGNLHTTALIGRDGSIDWLCLPYLDSPSVFGALLDDQQGGRFAVRPRGEYDATARYRPGTNVLETLFRTRDGRARLVDFMPIPAGGAMELEEATHEVYRQLEVTEGRIEFEVVFEPRFDYARAETVLSAEGPRVVQARGGGEEIRLSATHDLEVRADRAEAAWTLAAGEQAWLHLVYGAGEAEPLNTSRGKVLLSRTSGFWRRWLERSETGRTVDLGSYKPMVDRSALLLKLLYYEPTGAIAAAPTTSLPERLGGARNWDYRYSWLRDSAFTLQALFELGHLSETEGYLQWLQGLCAAADVARLGVMYGLRGESDLAEIELDHLDGYKGSRPVRVGNAAAGQRQMDVYGEVMDAALKLSHYVGKIDASLWPFLAGVCDHVAATWSEPDAGIWEVRDKPAHFVHSKVMCWVALDRGLTIARRYGFPGDLEKWEVARSAIKADVLDRGYNRTKRAFVQRYGAEDLDATALLIPLVGFLPMDDDRVQTTLARVEAELGDDGFLDRYRSPDGLPGGEGAFLLCTFWLIDGLIAAGQLERAEEILRRVQGAANHLGLFAEQYDPEWREPLGNFPQAFTHIGYINSVVALQRAKQALTEPVATDLNRTLLTGSNVLNAGECTLDLGAERVAAELKGAMNVLRGSFLDVKAGRVAYERMADSPLYGRYVEISRCLNQLDLDRFPERDEKLAFWINLYNVLVIHGVIALGIVDSVKEVRNFFRRIRYLVGGLEFTPDDIEHGILRGNVRPPNALFRPFKGKDPRQAHVVTPLEPRIHFALVCASSSCPPIEVYTAPDLDRQLDVSARTFIGGGGVALDRGANRVTLSRIFKWYGPDFGRNQAERLRFIAPFLHEPDDRAWLEARAESVGIDFQDYDWRLNRG